MQARLPSAPTGGDITAVNAPTASAGIMRAARAAE